jgi:prefoldin subunit 5
MVDMPIKLENIYTNPNFAASVRAFSGSEFNSENIDFLLELNSQVHTDGTKPIGENPATTPEELYKKYIKDEVINIPAVVRKKIIKDYEEVEKAKEQGLKTPTFTIENIKPAAKEIEKMYSVDGFKRYQQSKQYENFLLSLGSSVAYESWREQRIEVMEKHIEKLENLRNVLSKGVEGNILGKENEENRKVLEKINAEILSIRERMPHPRDFSDDKLNFIEKARNWFADTAIGKFFGVQPTTTVEQLKSDKEFNIRRMDSDLEDLEGEVNGRLNAYQKEKEDHKLKAEDVPVPSPMTFSFSEKNKSHLTDLAPAPAPTPQPSVSTPTNDSPQPSENARKNHL